MKFLGQTDQALTFDQLRIQIASPVKELKSPGLNVDRIIGRHDRVRSHARAVPRFARRYHGEHEAPRRYTEDY